MHVDLHVAKFILSILCVLQYYQAASEADASMTDKAGIAANQDNGRDEDAAVKALKKHKVRDDITNGREVHGEPLLQPLFY